MSKITPQIEEIKTSLSALQIFELIKDEPYSFFLDSSTAYEKKDLYKLDRYSFLGSNPFIIFRSKSQDIEIILQDSIQKFQANPLEILELLLNEYKITSLDTRFPFQCGAVGYFGYELYPFIESKIPLKEFDDIFMPECYLGFYDPIIIFDHLKNKVFICKCGFSKDTRIKATWIKKILTQKSIKPSYFSKYTEPNLSLMTNNNLEKIKQNTFISNFNKDEYIKTVLKIKDYIARGDIYQANLSQRFSTNFNLSELKLYRHLRQINPAPFTAFLNFDTLKILSSSPERFLKVTDGIIQTRPIKGTRPRGIDKIQDSILKKQLLESEKDRAEHIMIVDLERNDLGKICDYGSINVEELAILETYSTVFHLVSTITGRLSKGVGPVDCLRACFPGGSITGAPKIRAMQILNELEPTRRDIYTGSIGYISFNGNLDLSIVIRTLLIKDRKAHIYTGGGIVADSNPEEEYNETITKAKALMIALNEVSTVLNR